MSIKVNYSYNNYKYSEKATRLSKALSILSTYPMYAVYCFFFCGAISILAMSLGIPDSIYMPASFIMLIPFVIFMKIVRKKLERKIDDIARKDIAEKIKSGEIKFN